jgi:hypothetical protein
MKTVQYFIGLVHLGLRAALWSNASIDIWTLQQISNNNLVVFNHLEGKITIT